jgi:hypothetical protein
MHMHISSFLPTYVNYQLCNAHSPIFQSPFPRLGQASCIDYSYLQLLIDHQRFKTFLELFQGHFLAFPML